MAWQTDCQAYVTLKQAGSVWTILARSTAIHVTVHAPSPGALGQRRGVKSPYLSTPRTHEGLTVGPTRHSPLHTQRKTPVLGVKPRVTITGGGLTPARGCFGGEGVQGATVPGDGSGQAPRCVLPC